MRANTALAHRPNVPFEDTARLVRCAAVPLPPSLKPSTARCGKLSIYPKVMVPLQIHRAIDETATGQPWATGPHGPGRGPVRRQGTELVPRQATFAALHEFT